MNKIFSNKLHEFFLIFFNDILILIRPRKVHLMHLDEVLDILEGESLFSKDSKCEFELTKFLYLGYIINSKGVSLNLRKGKFYLIGLYPLIPHSLRGSLRPWATWFLYKVCQRVSTIGWNTHRFNKKWILCLVQINEKYFDHFKYLTRPSHILAISYFSKSFEHDCDVSNEGIGSTLF